MLGRALLLALALVPGLPAQIVTDRPDFVESSRTVGRGALQIETSVAHERDGDARAYATPTLLRVGVADRLELRAESDLFVREREGGVAQSGLADLSVGAKWAALEGGAALPATALLLHADLPSGSTGFRGEGVRPSLRAVLEWELSERVSLGMMPGVARADGPAGVHTAGIYGIVLGRSWTDRFRTFVELALEHVADSADGGTVGTWNAGTAWLLAELVQVDAALSLAATDAAPAAAFTVGLSSRTR